MIMVDTTPTAIATALRNRAGEMARRALESPAASPASLRGLIELCRQEGHLGEARALADRLAGIAPDDVVAKGLSDIFNRRPHQPPAAPDQAPPIPFVRVMDFLSAELRRQIDAMVDRAIPAFNPARVYSDEAGAQENPTDRRSLVLNDTKAFADLLLPLVKAAVEEHDVLSVLGVHIDGVRRYELEATCHGDGAFFKAHTDSRSQRFRPRKISFVYYFHTQPKAFTGGDLLLFDAPWDAKDGFRHAFTRIAPADNSIVFFPSAATHEVEVVRMPGGHIRDGRFTLNGWIRTMEG